MKSLNELEAEVIEEIIQQNDCEKVGYNLRALIRAILRIVKREIEKISCIDEQLEKYDETL